MNGLNRFCICQHLLLSTADLLYPNRYDYALENAEGKAKKGDGTNRKMNANESTQDYFAYDQEKLHRVLFPVELRPVQVMMEWPQAESEAGEYPMKAPRHRAVVDMDRRSVFTVVTDNYELIKNSEAIELGRDCFQTVFKLTDLSKMMLFNIIMPGSRSFCHIDFVHREVQFNYFDDDPWTPFLRITNSYNRTRLLSFDIGFCRGVCKNGIIFGKKNIEFKFTHSKSIKRSPKAEFRLRSGEFLQLEAQFRQNLQHLQRYHVPPRYMWPLVCMVFRLTPPNASASPRQNTNWDLRRNAIWKLTDRYFGELGQNGYAALNVLTDYATRPPAEISAESRVNGFQTASGEWVLDFVSKIESREFTFERYLGDYAQLAI